MIPYHKQQTDFYCGPAVVQMALARIGVVFTQEQLAREMGTTSERGTTADAIIAALELHGLSAVRTNGATLADIAAALEAGKLALVGYIEPEGDPHYALATAVTDAAITLVDPLFGQNYSLPVAEFEARWRDTDPHVYGDRLLITIS